VDISHKQLVKYIGASVPSSQTLAYKNSR